MTDDKMTEDQIDYLIDQWHSSDYTCTLPEFLGWTEEEYAKWVELK